MVTVVLIDFVKRSGKQDRKVATMKVLLLIDGTGWREKERSLGVGKRVGEGLFIEGDEPGLGEKRARPKRQYSKKERRQKLDPAKQSRISSHYSSVGSGIFGGGTGAAAKAVARVGERLAPEHETTEPPIH